MKKIFACIIITIATLVGLQSCGEDGIKGSSTFYAKVSVSPDVVKNGDQVEISLKPANVSGGNISIDLSSSVTINGKDVIKSVSYFIDGEKVGSGSNKNDGYSFALTIQDMNAGEYKVAAHCESNFKDYIIDEHITEATLVIE